MITETGNKYADALLAEAKQNDDMANLYAVRYAQTDDQKDKSSFQKYAEKAGLIRKMYTDFCAVMHGIEAEMTKRLTKKEEL